MAKRFSLSVLVGLFVTLGLFYLMQALIQGADSALSEDKIGNLVDFVRIKQDQDLQTKQRKPKKPPPPDEPPPETPPKNFDVNEWEMTLSEGRRLWKQHEKEFKTIDIYLIDK